MKILGLISWKLQILEPPLPYDNSVLFREKDFLGQDSKGRETSPEPPVPSEIIYRSFATEDCIFTKVHFVLMAVSPAYIFITVVMSVWNFPWLSTHNPLTAVTWKPGVIYSKRSSLLLWYEKFLLFRAVKTVTNRWLHTGKVLDSKEELLRNKYHSAGVSYFLTFIIQASIPLRKIFEAPQSVRNVIIDDNN